ncbi:hypothetical protein MPH_14012 [Macrophomina phaseolina MS6]|uniref:Uncharacterized protein n=1 Tax=Macrophomina phaseolina (strain MS6) TaxID=1126212 RepID=K2QGZ3_MACPH|nr:hypothetical protein MPH_14012 [Macrophomina phaseolina MS6]
MDQSQKINWSHIGRIMETEDGKPSEPPCDSCRRLGTGDQCWIYTREAAGRFNFRTPVCAKCRALAIHCSLNPFVSGRGPLVKPVVPTISNKLENRIQKNRTPSRDESPMPSAPSVPTSTPRAPVSRPASAADVTLESLASRFYELENKVKVVQQENNSLKEENQFLRSRIEEVEARSSTQDHVKAVEAMVMEEELAALRNQKDKVQEDHNDMKDKLQKLEADVKFLKERDSNLNRELFEVKRDALQFNEEKQDLQTRVWGLESSTAQYNGDFRGKLLKLETCHQERSGMEQRIYDLEAVQDANQDLKNRFRRLEGFMDQSSELMKAAQEFEAKLKNSDSHKDGSEQEVNQERIVELKKTIRELELRQDTTTLMLRGLYRAMEDQ